MSQLALERFDHLVLTVRDVDATCQFYERVLRMRKVTFGEGRVALAFGHQKINVHPAQQGGPRLVAAHPTPGSADLCFLTATPVEQWVAHLAACEVPLVEGPGRRAGAEGPILSIYFRDPDGNLIEVSNPVDR